MGSRNLLLTGPSLALLLAVLLAVTGLLMAAGLEQLDGHPTQERIATPRSGKIVLGADGGSSTCIGQCSGGAGDDSVAGAGATEHAGSSLQGARGEDGAPGAQGSAGADGGPSADGSAGASGSDGSSTAQIPSTEGTVAPDQFRPIDPGSTQVAPPPPEPACAAGDLLGLGGLLAPVTDLLKLLQLC